MTSRGCEVGQKQLAVRLAQTITERGQTVHMQHVILQARALDSMLAPPRTRCSDPPDCSEGLRSGIGAPSWPQKCKKFHESLVSQAHTGFSIFTNSNFALFPWPKDFTK